MATVVVMPQLGNSVESCLIISWQVKVGDEVAVDGVLCEVETDKASMEVPSTAAGTVLAILWEEGDDVPVKDPIVVVGDAGEDPQPALDAAGWKGKDAEEEDVPTSDEGPHAQQEREAAPESESPDMTGDASQPSQGAAEAASGQASNGASSPRARNLAQSKNIDIDAVQQGSGPGGRVIERDVQAVLDGGGATLAAARAGAQPGEGTGLGGRVSTADLGKDAAAEAPKQATFVTSGNREYPGPTAATPLKGIRKVISERMMHSLASSAQLTYTSTAKAAGLLAMRKKLKNSPEELGLNKVTIGDLVGFAAVKAAAKHTNHNGHLEDGTFTTFENVHLGMAVDTPRGLLVPTVRNASQMSLREFSATSKDLAYQAIDGKINPDLLAGATFTVSNLGGFGIESFTPLLNVPQVAILGVDAIFPRATIDEDGNVGVEQRIGFSLTADHRVIDGADAARFLQDLVKYIENIDITALG
ncbi:dihydrolipoamide acetyltransferase family protein [Tessaracoccus massiliensis]|uniref:dihydrolipoamide acetyltransferase family protein n=1 Tax=Tessaracoccus massiliensis TaxID=1522311 RepID=UPI00058F2893|nr:dihydrolipoamide acetyltransferase family protein [Tessaracoccus massiliensis]